MESTLKSIEIDGELKEFDSNLTFGLISDQIRGSLSADRVLAEIFVDDRSIDISEEEQLNSQFVKDLGRVVLRTRNVDDLFRESLQSAPSICQVLVQDCDDVQTFMNNSQFEEAHERVIEMTALLEWLIQLMMGAQSLGDVEANREKWSKTDLMESITRMQYQLVQIHFYLGSQNWDEFRKALDGTFKSELTVWKSIFDVLAKQWSPRGVARES